MPTRDEIVAAAPKFLRPGRNWSGRCEAAMWNLCDQFSDEPVRSFPDATSAREASHIEGPGFGPGQNFVWMSGVFGRDEATGRWVDFGHTCYHFGGGLLFMASSSTDPIRGFTALGFIDGGAYLRRFPNQKLEGWSWDHGGTRLDREDIDIMDDATRRYFDEKFRAQEIRLERLEAKADDGLSDHDNIGAHITRTVQDSEGRIISVAAREGRGGRAYRRQSDGATVAINEDAPSCLDLRGDPNPDQALDNLRVRGWCQDGVKLQSDDDFAFTLRQFDRIAAATGPLSDELVKVAYPSGVRPSATPVS